MSYFLTKHLPSCFVERKLLEDLENYVLRKLTVATPSGSNPAYEFVVIEKTGVERLKSVKDYQRAYFPDGTTTLSLKGSAGSDNSLEIKMSFASNREDSTIQILVIGNSEREVANGIAAEVFTILNSYRNYNRFFHPFSGSQAITGIAVFLLGLNLLLLGDIKTRADLILQTILMPLMLLLMMHLSVSHLKPYSVIETRRNERRKKQVNWVVLGFLGFILFTVIGVYFRQKLFGF